MNAGLLTKKLEQNITTEDANVIKVIQGVARFDRKRNEDLHRQINMLPIVQVLNKNTLRRFGHVTMREEESTLRVVMQLNMKGNRRI